MVHYDSLSKYLLNHAETLPNALLADLLLAQMRLNEADNDEMVLSNYRITKIIDN
jgi:hypothetical protein